MNNLLDALNRGDMWCWVLVDADGLKAVWTATVTQDICARTRNLLVYSYWQRQSPTADEANSMLRATVGLAKTQGCERLQGYTLSRKATQVLAKLPRIRPMVYIEADIYGGDD